MLAGDRRALCLACADLDHLVFLPAGDATVTRRARKHSTLTAVVLKWSRARKRYERQGLLVEDQALEQAEKECLADSEVRELRRQRAAERRADLDQQYVERFAARVRELYPHCPAGREIIIAEHACLKYSGRVGRTASAKSLADEAVDLAVVAHIRTRTIRTDRFAHRADWTGRRRRGATRNPSSAALASVNAWGSGTNTRFGPIRASFASVTVVGNTKAPLLSSNRDSI